MSVKSQPQPATPWIALVGFAAIVALLGGASRADAVQLVVLRPLAALFLVPAIYYFSREAARPALALISSLGLLALWMTLQLVPLPPAVWHELPGRAPIVEMDTILGFEEVWRPLSMVPGRGWNALASLVVPISALLLAVAFKVKARMLLWLIAGLGVFDAALGLLQVLTGKSSVLYYYALTNQGSPVGVFANENHSAAFSALALLTIARLGATTKAYGDAHWLRLSCPPAFVLVLIAALVSGSRAGLAVALMALVASGLIVWLALVSQDRRKRRGKLENWMFEHRRAGFVVMAGVSAALVASFFFLERAPGLADIFAENTFEDLRWQLWPVLKEMVAVHWIWGVGFGSFEEVYHIFEPASLLLPSYLNQAHNDWLQLVIEGGIPATLILLFVLGWILLSLRKIIAQPKYGFMSLVYWVAAFGIIGAASIIDYPLRTPFFQVIGVWLLLALAKERDVH